VDHPMHVHRDAQIASVAANGPTFIDLLLTRLIKSQNIAYFF
jgi:hypothetical protein